MTTSSDDRNYPFAQPYPTPTMPDQMAPIPPGSAPQVAPFPQAPLPQQPYPPQPGYPQPIQPGYQPGPGYYPQPYPPQQPTQPGPGGVGPDVVEESYIENILRLNRGKIATFYLTYSDSLEWRDRTYRGVIEAAGRDHIVISDPRDGKRYILLSIYLDWIEFTEEINYEYPFR